MTILGIDLSLTQTGLAIADEGRIVWTGTVKTTGKRNDGLEQRTARLRDIRNLVEAAVMRYNPVLAVIEAPSYQSTFGSSHDRSGLWWLIVDMLFLRTVPTAQVSPPQRAKYGTGSGSSDKKEVHAYVKARYGRDDLPIKTNDEADAVLLAAMGARHLGTPVERGDLDESLLSAMDKVVWP